MRLYKQLIKAYLIKKILNNLGGIFLILSIILLGNQFFLVLSQTINHGIYSSELIPLMFLKWVRDIPFLLGFSFVLSLSHSLNQLYKNSEMVIFKSAGIGNIAIYKKISSLILLISLFVLIFTNFITPYAKYEIEKIKNDASLRPDYIFLKEGVFQNFRKNDTTFYSSAIEDVNNSENQKLKNIFIFSESNNKLILAREGFKKVFDEERKVILELSDGNIYESFLSPNPRVTNFKLYAMNLVDDNKNDLLHIINAEQKSTIDLIKDSNSNNFSEMQLRFSLPLSIMILSLTVIFFSKTSSRSKRNFSLAYATTFYFVYYNLMIFITDLIQNSETNLDSISLLPHLIFVILNITIYFIKDKPTINKAL